MTLLLDVFIWFCHVSWPSLRQSVCFCVYVLLYIFLSLLWLSSLIIWPNSETVHHLYFQPFTAHPWNMPELRCAILSTNVLSWCRVLSTVSFLIRSHLVTRNSVLNHVISAATILRSSSFLTGLVYVKPRSGLQTVEWNQWVLNELVHFRQWLNTLIPRWPTVDRVAYTAACLVTHDCTGRAS